ncbi:MAG: DNA-3-methyladenine glycosylase family protein [Candidatus Dormibacteria bacterium]
MTAAPGAKLAIRRERLRHGPLDLVATTFPLRQGRDDPTIRVAGGEVWRALRTPAGPATLCLRVDGDELEAAALGPGAAAALDLAPQLAGLHDNPAELHVLHPALAEARRRRPGLRLTSGTSVFDALVWVVMAQKVVGPDARRAYRDLVRRVGDPAPGGVGLLLPPDPRRLAVTPYWTFHACNVEQRRAAAIVAAARRASALDRLAGSPAAEARNRLQSLPGVGPWTAAEVTAVSHGDPDAVPLGDFHLPNVVAYALAGEPRATDLRMLELLQPYAGQRGRVIRLLMSAGGGAPRHGPKLSRQDIRGR